MQYYIHGIVQMNLHQIMIASWTDIYKTQHSNKAYIDNHP